MSTSTGYHPKTIVREQPSSSGQVMCFQTGCIERFESGAATRRAIAKHTSATTSITVLNGHKRLASTIANTWYMRVPKPGDNWTITVCSTVSSTAVQTIVCSSAGSKAVQVGSTGGKKFAIVVAPTSKNKFAGVTMNITALSSKMLAVVAHRTTSVQVTFTSAT